MVRYPLSFYKKSHTDLLFQVGGWSGGRWEKIQRLFRKLNQILHSITITNTNAQMDNFLADIMNNYFEDDVPMDMSGVGISLVLDFLDYQALGAYLLNM